MVLGVFESGLYPSLGLSSRLPSFNLLIDHSKSILFLLGIPEVGGQLLLLVATNLISEEIAKRYSGMYVLLWTAFGFAGITSYGVSPSILGAE